MKIPGMGLVSKFASVYSSKPSGVKDEGVNRGGGGGLMSAAPTGSAVSRWGESNSCSSRPRGNTCRQDFVERLIPGRRLSASTRLSSRSQKCRGWLPRLKTSFRLGNSSFDQANPRVTGGNNYFVPTAMSISPGSSRPSGPSRAPNRCSISAHACSLSE
jgi:hypothetical protein